MFVPNFPVACLTIDECLTAIAATATAIRSLEEKDPTHVSIEFWWKLNAKFHDAAFGPGSGDMCREEAQRAMLRRLALLREGATS